MCVIRSVLVDTIKLGIVTTRKVESTSQDIWRWLKGVYREAQRDLARQPATSRPAPAKRRPTRRGAGARKLATQ